MIRLIGIDVDGTLLDTRGQMPQAERRRDPRRGRAPASMSRSSPAAAIRSRGRSRDPLPVVHHAHRQQRRRRARHGRIAPARSACSIATSRARCSSRRRPFRHAAALVFDRDADRQVMFETMDWEHPGRKATGRATSRSSRSRCRSRMRCVEDPIQVMFNGGVAGHARRCVARRCATDAREFAVSLTEYEHRDFSLIDVTVAGRDEGRARSPGAPHSSASRARR